MGTCSGGMCCSRQAGGSATELQSRGKSGAGPVFFGSPSPVGEGGRSVVSFRNFSVTKTSPMLYHPRMRERVSLLQEGHEEGEG